jgi:hypothetical protein
MKEMFKKVPLPIWIGLGLILIVILLMNRGGSKPSTTTASGNVTAPVGPVTTSTMGTQGAQSGAGTDQELANLSSITQGGFEQINWQNQSIAKMLAGNMTGIGTPMQQFGNSMQANQNQSAASNAQSGTPGQNAGSNPSTVP